MELSKELIEKTGLKEEQVSAISEWAKDQLANEKKAIEDQFKGEANKNAEGIISGAAAKAEQVTGIKRNEGEKFADYLNRVSGEYLATKSTELDTLKKEYEEKVKKASGTDLEAIKKQYQDEKDALLKKYADYDELKEKATKADEYGQKLSGLKLQVAFNEVKPAFPDTVNPYEAKAKWDDFKKGVLEKYEIELDGENNPIYVDKENKFKTGKLSELVTANAEIAELLKGRQQGGTGGKPVSREKIEGVPFTIESGANVEQISKAIKEYLLTDGKMSSVTAPGYSEKFKEYFQKIKQKTAA